MRYLKKLYEQSISDPDSFWREYAQIVEWITP
ncbi:hypothetical protein CE195_08475, partial [Sodalis-like symbiont of Philaenus spumarius]